MGGEFGLDANCLNAYQASSIFAVDRLFAMKKINVDEFDYIILDRYTPSNMIHQACKIENSTERDKCLNWLFDFEYNKLELPKPDKVVFLNMPIDVSLKLAAGRKTLKNGQKQDIHENNQSYMHHAYDCAKYVAKKYDWDIIDCCKGNKVLTVEEIHNKILKAIGI